MPHKPSSAPPKLYLFGPFRLENESGPVRLPTRKVESLLAYLVLHPEEHTREKLAALFWGDSTDKQARDSLRTALKSLRQQLGDELLLGDRETVQLSPAFSLWVDVREFEKQLADSAESAVSLYRGDFLGDFYDEWIMPAREHLRELYLSTLLRLAQEARTEGRFGQAVEWAKKVLALDAANEAAHRHLMFCYSALGNKAAALKQYEECVRVMRAELDVEPSSETTALYHEIKESGGEQKFVAVRLTNLPIPLTSFVGRQREIKEIKGLLGHQRLVTLTGAGGSGKTRLSIQVASDLVGEFEDGVCWVELAALSDNTLVPQALARALGVREVPNQPLSETLASYLHAKKMLVVLDNCEHLVEACARLAEHLLGACASLRILATSREALGLTAEQVWQVPTLTLPDPTQLPLPQLLARYEGIQLFVERAIAVKSDFELTTQNAFAVAQVCRRLDGIPLAIELAAARVKFLGPQEIAVRLGDRFSLLTGGSRTALPRHQTLRAAIDWSFDLLIESERILFRRLSVFAGGFTLNAAEQVCSDEKLTRRAILDLLARLVDRSLVVVDHSREAGRYRMLETIREYAREKLGEAGEAETVRNRHLDFFIELAERAEPRLDRAEQQFWLDHLEVEIDNLRGAIEWAMASGQGQGALRLVGSLCRFWVIRDHHNEAADRLKLILGRADAREPTDARLKALNAYFFILWPVGKLTAAQELIEEAMALGAKLQDRLNMAFASLWAGASAMERGDFARAQSYLEQSRTMQRESGDSTDDYWPLVYLGELAMFQREYTHAEAYFEQALTLLREVRDDPYLGMVLRRLGQLAMLNRDQIKAFHLFEESLGNNWSVHDYMGVGASIAAFAALNAAQDNRERAARLLGSVEALLEFIRMPLIPFDQKEYERNVNVLREQLEARTFAAAWAEGRAMTVEQAVGYALEETARS